MFCSVPYQYVWVSLEDKKKLNGRQTIGCSLFLLFNLYSNFDCLSVYYSKIQRLHSEQNKFLKWQFFNIASATFFLEFQFTIDQMSLTSVTNNNLMQKSKLCHISSLILFTVCPPETKQLLAQRVDCKKNGYMIKLACFTTSINAFIYNQLLGLVQGDRLFF